MPSASFPPQPHLQPSDDPGHDGLASVDRTLRLIHVSAALVAQLGQPASSLREQLLADALPAWAPTLEPALRLVFETGVPVLSITLPPGLAAMPQDSQQRHVASLYPVFNRDGAVLDVDLVFHLAAPPPAPAPTVEGDTDPVFDGDETIASVGPSLQSLDTRTQQGHHRQERGDLLDQSFEAIVGWEPGGSIVLWSRGAEELYGFTRLEALGQVSHHLLGTVYPQPTAEIEADLVAAGRASFSIQPERGAASGWRAARRSWSPPRGGALSLR
jgi:hypothetical protein